MTQTARHYGFAQVPRDVTRGKHKNLSLVEKGLYACLKDICGDDGECFYTFRNLAAEINTSISTLSRYIPKLVDKGLIIAGKKPGQKNNHEIYHITIVNIWQENDATYRPLEIVSDRNKVVATVANGNKDGNSVSDRNNIVSNRNKNNGHSSEDCFNLNDRIRGEEESTEEENDPSSTQTSSQKNDPEVQRIWNFYCQLFDRKKPDLDEYKIKQCKELAPYVQTLEEMKSLAQHARDVLKTQGKNPTIIYLGNMVNANVLNSWKKPGSREPTPLYPSQKPPTGRLNATQKRMEEERLERLTQQTAIGGN